MPRSVHRALAVRFAYLGLAVLAFAQPYDAAAQTTSGSGSHGRRDKNAPVVYTADQAREDDVNNTVTLVGHVEIVQGPNMLLADRVIWNRDTDIVTATGDVKLVDDKGDIYFGDYLEITDDMREGFIENVSALLADNSRLVGRHAERKDGKITEIDRGVYSPCQLCTDDPTKAPTWQIKAVKIIHDTDEKRIYYHDATFEIDGIPILWTPYFSTYDPSVKRASGFLDSYVGYRSQLGAFARSTYYFDIAPDMDATVEGGYFSHQGPLLGGEFRERFDNGQITVSGSVTESNIRQNPQNALNPDEKTVRGDLFAKGEFDLSENWRAGFEFDRSEDAFYVRKYGFTSLDVLPEHFYVEGFFDRGYINASLYSFQDLRPNINQQQPHALPYIEYSFFGDPGATFGGRWADSGSLLTIQRFQSPGEKVERIANNASWERKLISDTGLVTDLNASVETDYYWTQDATADPVTNLNTVKPSVGRFFPQAYAIVSYPLVQQFDYAKVVIEPIVSVVAAPSNANNKAIPNEDSQDVEFDQSNIFGANRFPGIDRVDDGSRVSYGVRAGLYNLGTGYTTIFLGQTYQITNSDAIFAPNSGLQTRRSDYIGQIEMNPGRLFDIDYRFEVSNDFKQDRLQEINFRIGPERYAIFGTYLFAPEVNVPNFTTQERNEMTIGASYKIDDNWAVSASATAEISHPRAVLRYALGGGYSDDCSSFTLNVSHDQTQPIGGTSGTAVFLQFSLKNLGIFRTPSIH